MSTMGVIQQGTSSVVVDLPEQHSIRRLEQALRAKVDVRLDVKVNPDAAVTGTLARGDDPDTIVVELADGAASPAWRSAYCDVAFTLRHDEYMFTSVVLEVEAAAGRLVLSRPKNLRTWQRRRFVRASVADSTEARLGPPGEFGRCDTAGMILNVSPDGLACRVPLAAADRYAVDERLGVAFCIGSSSEEFRLDATVVSKTAAGTPGAVIVGLQFENSPTAARERERLASALHAFH
ncbi:MAG TPA: PilZ domain-containing protein [Phycisphaerae bacterium]|nr:PilZ domain-containing protein [Phycisphaerales bacterium]HRX85111.1 PilZ domain-containing protein [Phycisphaerae bacterium]